MSYRAQLHPWCIVRQLPQMQTAIVARCRRRSEAEEQVRVLRRLIRDGEFAIVFDLSIESTAIQSVESCEDRVVVDR